jgi:biopolymer transport protein ExbB/TolQ
MVSYIQKMGPFGPLLLVLAVVIAVLSIKKAIDLFARTGLTHDQLGSGLHAILFWGAVSAALGVLGQLSGVYRALNVISTAREIDAKIVAMGFAESLTTTIFGLVVLVVSAIIWFVLFARCRKLTSVGA